MTDPDWKATDTKEDIFEDEIAGDGVDDDWDASSSEDDKKTDNNEKSSSKTTSSKAKDRRKKERKDEQPLTAEEKEKQEAQMQYQLKMSELRQVEELVDLKVSGIDDLVPTNDLEWDQFKNLIVTKLTVFKDRPQFESLIEGILREVAITMDLESISKLSNVLSAVSQTKAKYIKSKTKKAKVKTKVAVKMERTDMDGGLGVEADDDQDDFDFM